MRQKPKVCHPSCGLSRRFRGFGYTLNTTATCTYSKEPFAKFGVGHEMGAECSCKITPSKGICTWLAMGFPGTTTLPDNKSRFLTNFAKGSKASIPATASRPSSQRMKVPTQDELTSLLHTKSKARHPDGSSETGTPGRIRTCDPLLRRQVLYPTELRALVWFGGRLERVSRRTLDLASFLDQGLLITGSLLQNSDLHLASHGFPPGSAGVPPAFL